MKLFEIIITVLFFLLLCFLGVLRSDLFFDFIKIIFTSPVIAAIVAPIITAVMGAKYIPYVIDETKELLLQRKLDDSYSVINDTKDKILHSLQINSNNFTRDLKLDDFTKIPLTSKNEIPAKIGSFISEYNTKYPHELSDAAWEPAVLTIPDKIAFTSLHNKYREEKGLSTVNEIKVEKYISYEESRCRTEYLLFKSIIDSYVEFDIYSRYINFN